MQKMKDLISMLANLSPTVNRREMVFCSLPEPPDMALFSANVFAIVREQEGWTVIVERQIADRFDWLYEGIFCCITLQVHSSLEAVGLTAVVATRLSDLCISANVVAGFYHDHIFVPIDRTDEAIRCLKALQKQ